MVVLLVGSGGGLISCTRGIRPSPEQRLSAALHSVASDIGHQLGPARGSKRRVVADPFLDGQTGQQNRACERVQAELIQAMGSFVSGVEILPFDSKTTAVANLILTGTLTALDQPDHYRISVALSDRASGLVIGQSAALFSEPRLDLTPTEFYGDSPSLVRDRSTEGYLKTAETQRGQQADALYIEQIPTSALLSEALAAYNEERWQDALSGYTQASERRDGQQLRTFNGIYLCHSQLGNKVEAELAFTKLVTLGLATNNLAVKILFQPGSIEFWADPKVSGAYPMWLRQIASGVAAGDSCLNIVGHTSRSGSEATNDRLSLARAERIRERLQREAPRLAKRLRVSGVGFRENIVGTGTDDASDALDRRVEFKVLGCAPTAVGAQPANTDSSASVP